MNSKIKNRIDSYSVEARKKFYELRSLILKIAELNQLGPVEEALKWGEPSFLNKNGSTIRIDWKSKTPERIYLFFNCKTNLVETFREIFFDVFDFQDNRSIALETDRPVPQELETCLLMALNYHNLKKLPLLGG